MSYAGSPSHLAQTEHVLSWPARVSDFGKTKHALIFIL